MVRRYTTEDIGSWVENSVDPKSRTIYMSSVLVETDGKESGVDSYMAEYTIKGLHVLKKSSAKKPIRVLMNNIGGDWFHGMAIYDAIRSCGAPVDIEVFGCAMSMGAVILQAGRKRLLHPNSALMIHDGYSDAADRPVQSARNWSNYDERLRKRMYEIFAERSGREPKHWRRKCTHDTLMTPEESVKQGLADKVLYPKRKLPNLKSKTRKKR